MQETQETWVRSLGWEDPLEEDMAIPSSILAWKIPWTKEPDGLQSMGLQRAGCTFIKFGRNVGAACMTLRDSTDCSLPGSFVHGIFQARILEWVAVSYSRMFGMV